MKKRNWILLAGALGIVAVAAFVTRSYWMGGNASAQAPHPNERPLHGVRLHSNELT